MCQQKQCNCGYVPDQTRPGWYVLCPECHPSVGSDVELREQIEKLKAELSRCVKLLDTECLMPDGSNANTMNAHELLGNLKKGEEENEVP